MKVATVVFATNGYNITGAGVEGPGSLFAASVPEVTYWLGRYFLPFDTSVQSAPQRTITPRDVNDPRINRTVTVSDVNAGGFFVAYPADQAVPPKYVQTFCVNMDEVAQLLELVYAAP